MLFFMKDSPIFLLSINVNWLFLFFLSNLNLSSILLVVIEMFFISFNEVGSVNFLKRFITLSTSICEQKSNFFESLNARQIPIDTASP